MRGRRRDRAGVGRALARWTILTSVVVGGAPPARGQEPPTEASQAAPPAAGGLFDSDDPLELRIAVDLKTLVNDRDSLKAEDHPAVLTYRVGDGAPVSVDVKVKTRGHWRRQVQHCDFPPLRLNFPESKVEGTLFASQDKLKLVTPCRPRSRAYVEYILREYLVYRVYNLLTPLSPRARLARTTYVDVRGRMDSLTTQTFLVEDMEQLAARNGAQLLDVRGARFSDMDSLQMGLMGVFLYMIGDTDWSLGGQHNIDLVLAPDRGTVYPIAYDFDFTGIVSTIYAKPDQRLRIVSVRQRLYRGTCLTDEHWEEVLAPFREHRAAVYALYESQPGLSTGYVKDTRGFLDDFYEVIDDPGKVSKQLVGKCSTEEHLP